MTDHTALANRLEAPGNTDGPVDPKAVYRTKPVALFEEAARRLRELGAEVERLTLIVDHYPGPLTLASYRARTEAAQARIAELEAERAWRPTVEHVQQALFEGLNAQAPPDDAFNSFDDLPEEIQITLRKVAEAVCALPTAPTERGTEETLSA